MQTVRQPTLQDYEEEYLSPFLPRYKTIILLFRLLTQNKIGHILKKEMVSRRKKTKNINKNSISIIPQFQKSHSATNLVYEQEEVMVLFVSYRS